MPYRRTILLTLLAAGLEIPTVAVSQTRSDGDAVRALLACRTLSDDTARLRCLDSRTADLQTQLERGDVVVATRGAINEQRQAQFGRNGRDLTPIPERAARPAPPLPTRVDTTIKSVATTTDGKWVMVLPDGARWQQIDGRTLARNPKPGMAIAIRRAAMGSYLANVAGQPAMRVRRMD